MAMSYFCTLPTLPFRDVGASPSFSVVYGKYAYSGTAPIVPAKTAFFTFASELLTKRAFSVPSALNTPMLSFGDHMSPVTPSRYTVGSMQVRVCVASSASTEMMKLPPPGTGSIKSLTLQAVSTAPVKTESSADLR